MTELPSLDLRADCSRCVGLCCVAPAFAASADFAIDKPAGHACPHLGSDFGCTIHSRLRDRGFPGCTTFDCLGAGQQVVQVTFGGDADWRADPSLAEAVFGAFAVMRELHELLWYLSAALTYCRGRSDPDELTELLEQTLRFAQGTPAELASLDLAAHRDLVNAQLRLVSARVRADPPRGARQRGAADLRAAMLIGRDLRRRDLRRADLRGAYLLGADLRGVDLTAADLIGADLRAADVRGADLAESLFLTQMQVNAARGDAATRLPGTLSRPSHW